MSNLTINTLCEEAKRFSEDESNHHETSIYGATDGKKIGTYLEHKFRTYLQNKGYQFEEGNSASGIDFPDLGIDMKVTSIAQPQSSCPYKSARQKVYGLGYGLIVFVYLKTDDANTLTGNLRITNTIYVKAKQTADYQITSELRRILDNKGNLDDIVAMLIEKNLPLDEIGRNTLAQEILTNKPEQGYLTISNALQWRLQYSRVIDEAGKIPGVISVYRNI